MKNIVLFLILLCATISYGQGVNLKDRDSIAYNGWTTSDLIGVQRPSGGTYSWYRTSWYGLSFGVRRVILGQANTWTATNIFNDPVYLNDLTYNYMIMPFSAAFYSTIGQSNKPYKYGFITNLNINNPEDTLQVGTITYDGKKFIIDKPIAPADSSAADLGSDEYPFKTIYTDSVKSNNRIVLSARYGVEAGGIFQFNPQLNVAVTDDDSSLIVTSNFIEIAPTDTITIDTLYIDPDILGFTPGIEITIYNKTTYPVTFKDTNSGGFTNCMRMATDVVLNQFDSFKLIYYLNQSRWLQSGPFINND